MKLMGFNRNAADKVHGDLVLIVFLKRLVVLGLGTGNSLTFQLRPQTPRLYRHRRAQRRLKHKDHPPSPVIPNNPPCYSDPKDAI